MIRPVLAMVLLVAPARLGLAQARGEVELAQLPYRVRWTGW